MGHPTPCRRYSPLIAIRRSGPSPGSAAAPTLVKARPANGWLSLTGTETAVAELVSQGFTHQQVADQMFISVYMVAFHLRQVFGKLAISSRVERARIAVGQAEGRAARGRTGDSSPLGESAESAVSAAPELPGLVLWG